MTDSSDDARGRTPLACAAEAGDIGTVAELLAGTDGFDVDARDYDGRTSLAPAAENGHDAVVERLLAHGANPDLMDLDQVAPLWQAARYGHTSVVRLLLASKRLSDVNPQPVNLRKHSSEIPLSIAMQKGHVETAELLARAHGVDPSLTIVFSPMYGPKQFSVLWLAIRDGYEGVALALLKKCGLGYDLEDTALSDGGSGDSSTKDTIEPTSKLLALAISTGCSGVVRELLAKHGADVNVAYRYLTQERESLVDGSPLVAASRRGDLNAVRSLLDMDEIRPGLSSTFGAAALPAAAEGGFVDAVRMLIADARVEVDHADARGRTALSHAAEGAHEAIVAELLATGAADPNNRDDLARTPLNWAVDPWDGYGPGGWQPYEGVVRRLLADGRTDVNHKDSSSRTALSCAAGKGALGLVMAILEHPEIDPTAGPQYTPLTQAAVFDHADVVQALLNTGRVDVNTFTTEDGGETALMCASKYGYEKVVRVLLSTAGIDVNIRDRWGVTSLMLAAWRDRAEVVKRLLASGGDPNVQDNEGNTALSFTFQSEPEVTRLLLGAPGVKTDLPNNKGRTPLSLAAEAGEVERVEILLGCEGVNPDTRDNRRRSPLSWAFDEDDFRRSYGLEERKAVVKLLLRIPAVDPNAEDHYGLTPLLRAMRLNKSNTYVELLLSRPDLDVNRPRGRRGSPLDVAKKSRQYGHYGTLARKRRH
ncbi:HET domain-containing protein [Fusarium sp. LHS14.1]|nr:HET domain-containing protein [Fusarium sp. LHS14.1]